MTSHDPLTELLSTLLDGELTPMQREELACLLRSDKNARRRYTDLLLLDSLLHEQLGKDSMVGAVDMLGASSPSSHAEPAAVSSPARPRLRTIFLMVTSCAAMVAIVCYAIFSGAERPEQNPIVASEAGLAQLTEVEGKVELLTATGEARDVKAGEEIQPGQSLRTVGDGSFAIFKYEGVGKFELNPGTQVRLIEENAGTQGVKNIFLSQGVLRSEIAGAKGRSSLVVTTPHAEIRGPDSYFTCISTPEYTWIEVDHGQAKIVRQSDGLPMSLNRGFKTVVNLEQERPQILPVPLAIHRPEYEVGRAACTLAFTRDSKRLILAGHGNVWQLDLDLRKEKPLFEDKALNTHLTLLSGDARRLIFGFESTIHVWDVDEGKGLKTIATKIKSIRGFAHSVDGKHVAMAYQPPRGPRLVRIWNTKTGGEDANLTSPIPHIGILAFSPDGRYLAAGSSKGGVIVWDLQDLIEVARWESLSSSVEALAFSPDGRSLIAALANQLIFFDVAQARELKRIIEPGFAFRSVSYSSNGKMFAAGTSSGQVRLWLVANEQVLVNFKSDNRPIQVVEFSPDGRWLATATSRPVRVWRLPDEISKDD